MSSSPISNANGGSAHAERRERVVAAMGQGALILAAAPVRYKNADSEYRYRPDSDFYYLTGMTDPHGVLVLTGKGGEARSVLFLPDRDPAAERWHGPRIGPGEAVDRFGVDEAHPLTALAEGLPVLLGAADTIYYRLGASAELDASIRGLLDGGRATRRRSGHGPSTVRDPSTVLDEIRLRKDPTEVDAIRRAAAVTVAGHYAGFATVAPGVGEWQVEAAIDASFRITGAFGPAFSTIVASGPNACVLHHTVNDRTVGEHDLVLIDAGAEVGFYAGDVTRTIPASGRFLGEQRDLYEVVETARAAAVDAVAPGAPADAPHRVALERMVRGLVDLGILAGEPSELLEGEEHKAFIIHKTSHWLGLDVHDVGSYVVNGAPRPLEPGMVLTIEPGIYIPTDAEGVPERFRGLGIRIEDDVLVTAEGRENLTVELPTAPDEIEHLMAELRSSGGSTGSGNGSGTGSTTRPADVGSGA